MFQALKYCNAKYTAALNKVLEALEQMEADGQDTAAPAGDGAAYEEEFSDEQPE